MRGSNLKHPPCVALGAKPNTEVKRNFRSLAEGADIKWRSRGERDGKVFYELSVSYNLFYREKFRSPRALYGFRQRLMAHSTSLMHSDTAQLVAIR